MRHTASIGPNAPVEVLSGRLGNVIRNDVSSSKDQAQHRTEPKSGRETGRSIDQSEDAGLFARHLSGDHDALMKLFDLYNKRIWLYCARMLGDPRQADDVAQELWEKIIRLRGRDITPPAKPASYLFAAARNLCLNHFRSQRETASLDDLVESDHPRESMPEKSHLEELLAIALRQLPESQREVLVLNAYSGYGFDEIAELLDKPAGAIHTIAWRARKRLGALLSGLMSREEWEEKKRKEEE